MLVAAHRRYAMGERVGLDGQLSPGSRPEAFALALAEVREMAIARAEVTRLTLRGPATFYAHLLIIRHQQYMVSPVADLRAKGRFRIDIFHRAGWKSLHGCWYGE